MINISGPVMGSLCSEITHTMVYFGLARLVVSFVVVCELGAQAAHRDTIFRRPAYEAGS